jgi:hypothetical protein
VHSCARQVLSRYVMRSEEAIAHRESKGSIGSQRELYGDNESVYIWFISLFLNDEKLIVKTNHVHLARVLDHFVAMPPFFTLSKENSQNYNGKYSNGPFNSI